MRTNELSSLRLAADKIGISQSKLHGIIKDDGIQLRKSTLKQIAKGTGISEDDLYLVYELGNMQNSEKIRNMLQFVYQMRQAGETDITKAAEEFYARSWLTKAKIWKEQKFAQDKLVRLTRLRRTESIWEIYEHITTALLALQDIHLNELHNIGKEEFVGKDLDVNELFRKIEKAAPDMLGIINLYANRSRAAGYSMNLLSVPAGFGAYEGGTALDFGFEMGIVLDGKSHFFSRGFKKEDLFEAILSQGKTLCYSRHRAHVIFAYEKTRIILFQIPSAPRGDYPVAFRRKNNSISTAKLGITKIKDGRDVRRLYVPKSSHEALPDELKIILDNLEKTKEP